MKNLQLKKIKCCIICKSSSLKKISIVKNEIIKSQIKQTFFLLECNYCLHRTFSHIPGDAQLKKAYSIRDPIIIPDEIKYQSKKPKKYNFLKIPNLNKHWIFKYIDLNKKKNYFELGPGSLNLYKTFYSKGWTCCGIEPNLLTKTPGIKKNFKEINFKSDVAVALDVLEHVNNPVKYLKKINTIMRKNGKIFLTFPHSQSFKSKYLKEKWSMIAPFGHLNFFSKNSTSIMLKKTNFKVILVKDFSYVEPRRLIRNILRLPLYLINDLLSLKFKKFLERVEETILNIFDLINGDQLRVVAIKL
jgi:hypothetical protein